MRKLILLLALVLSLAPLSASACGMSALGMGLPCNVGAPAYTGPGDVVSAAKAWWGLRAYNAADRGNRLINICDPANVTCADWFSSPTTGALVATTNPLNGTDCTATGSCTIKTWYDRSGALFCSSTGASGGTPIACDVTEATAATRPVLLWNCNPYLPCALFNGTPPNQQLLTALNAGTSIPQPYAVSTVVFNIGGGLTAGGILWGGGAGLNYSSTADTVQVFAGTTISVGNITDGSNHALQATFNGASSVLYCGGSTGTSCSVTGVSNSVSPGAGAFVASSPFLLGSDNGTAYCSCGLSEAGIWALDFTASSRQVNMTANQYAYWGPF